MRHLMNNHCYVLVFRLDTDRNMDAHREYIRRRGEDGIVERVPCRVALASSNELTLHSMRGAEISHRVYFVDNPRLREENRLEIGGVQYILVGLPQNPSQDGRLWQLDVRAITHQNELVRVFE